MPTLPQPTAIRRMKPSEGTEPESVKHLRTKPGKALDPFLPKYLYELPPGALLMPSEVASLFRVDPKTVTRWLKREGSPLREFKTLGGHSRICVEDVRREYEKALRPEESK